MACCTEIQNECNRIITIGYLKNFVGTVVDIDNNTVTVTGNDNTYCPAYQELTNGAYTKYYVNGKTGIQITGTYAANQNVRQIDLKFIHTVFKSLTVNSSKNPLNACGDSATLSPSYTFTQTTKYMDDNCNVTSTPTDITQSISNAITYTSSNSDFTINGSTLSVGKNGGSSGGGGNVTTYNITPSDTTIASTGGSITFAATATQVASQYIITPSNVYQNDRYGKEVWFGWDVNSPGGGSITPGAERSTIVTGHVTVNGVARTGTSSSIRQPAVSTGGASGTRVGYYEKPISLEVITTDENGNPKSYPPYESVCYDFQAHPSCAKGIGHYEVYGSYVASDECGGASGTAVIKQKDADRTEVLPVQCVKLAAGCTCDDWGNTVSSALTFTWGGFIEDSQRFEARCGETCSGCGGGGDKCPPLTNNDGSTLHVSAAGGNQCDSVEGYGVSASSSDSWISVTSSGRQTPDGGACTLKFYCSPNGTGSVRYGTINLSGWADAAHNKECTGHIPVEQQG